MPPTISPLYDTLGAEGTYTEFPVDLVTDIHWKKKPPDDGGGGMVPVWVTQTGSVSFSAAIGQDSGGWRVLLDLGSPRNDGTVGSISSFFVRVTATVSAPFQSSYGWTVPRPMYAVAGEVGIFYGSAPAATQAYNVKESDPDATISISFASDVPFGPGTMGPVEVGYQATGGFCHALWWFLTACMGMLTGTAEVTVTVLDHYEYMPPSGQSE